MLNISTAPLRFRRAGHPWETVEGGDAALVRLLRANHPRSLSTREARKAIATLDAASELSLIGALGEAVGRRPDGTYGLRADVLFEVPPAICPVMNVPRENLGGGLEADALDRMMAEICGYKIEEGF